MAATGVALPPARDGAPALAATDADPLSPHLHPCAPPPVYNGPLSVLDNRWTTDFTDMYNFSAPFHTCFGNHDFSGSVAAQLDFKKDPRWNARLNGSLVLPEADATIVFVDSSRACPSYMTAPYGDCNALCAAQLANLTQGQPCTAATALPCWLSHVAWLNETLAGVTTKWKFVAGHHPIDDEHMPYMAPALNAHGVQAYFAGHVHNLQHVSEKGSPVNYFVSGAGAFGSAHEREAALLQAQQGIVLGETHKPRGIRHPAGRAWDAANWVGAGPGFLAVALLGDVAEAKFVRYDGTVLYNTTFTSSA